MVNTLVVASYNIKILDGLFVRCKYIMKWQCNQYNAPEEIKGDKQVIHQGL
jgi:hypothetical protein